MEAVVPRGGTAILTDAHIALLILYLVVPIVLLFAPKGGQRATDMGFIAFMIVFLFWLPIVLWMWYRGKL